MAKDKNAVAAAEPPAGTAVATQDISMDQLLADGRQTALQTTTQDLAIPFLRVLQTNSPQVNRDDPKYVQGAEAGMFINTVTGKLWDGRGAGVLVSVVAYQRNYTEWKPRGQGAGQGGFVKDWGSDDSAYKAARVVEGEGGKRRLVTDDGTEMVQAGNYYVFAIDEETGASDQMVLPLAGTQLKKSRRWNSLIKSEQMIHPETKQPFNPPPFFRTYRLTTVPEQNDKGNWKGLKIEPGPTLFQIPNGGMIYQSALNFKRSIDAGEVKVQPMDAAMDDPGSAGTQTRDAEDADAPF